MTATVNMLGMLLGLSLFVQIVIFALYMFFKKTKPQDEDLVKVTSKTAEEAKNERYGKFHGVLTRGEIREFMEFDKVKDGMIIRKNGKQFIMVIQGSGVNYDLASETDQLAIEQGFQQFLNVLKQPVQIYVQTRMVNFRHIIDGYVAKAEKIKQERDEVKEKLVEAKNVGNEEEYRKLIFELRGKENLYEYVLDAIKSTEEMSGNKHVLERKNYIVVSIYRDEVGRNTKELQEDEIEDKAYRELITRCRGLMEALSSAMVSTRILDSEELIDLLFVAYNRDDTEYINVEENVKADYDSFYKVSKDVFLKEKELIERKIEQDAMRLVTESIKSVDREKQEELIRLRNQRAKRIRKEAEERMKSFRGKAIDEDTYQKAKKKIQDAEIIAEEDGRAKIRLRSPKEVQENKNKNKEKENIAGGMDV